MSPFLAYSLKPSNASSVTVQRDGQNAPSRSYGTVRGGQASTPLIDCPDPFEKLLWRPAPKAGQLIRYLLRQPLRKSDHDIRQRDNEEVLRSKPVFHAHQEIEVH